MPKSALSVPPPRSHHKHPVLLSHSVPSPCDFYPTISSHLSIGHSHQPDGETLGSVSATPSVTDAVSNKCSIAVHDVATLNIYSKHKQVHTLEEYFEDMTNTSHHSQNAFQNTTVTHLVPGYCAKLWRLGEGSQTRSKGKDWRFSKDCDCKSSVEVV